jgi:hypothetical protein
MNAGRVIRIAWHVVCALAIIAVMLVPVFASWYWAAGRVAPSHRLRWVLVASANLPERTRLVADQIESRLAWLSAEDSTYISAASAAVGKYTSRPLKRGGALNRHHLALVPSLTPRSDGLIMPITIKADQAAGLKPGMRLAFAKAGSSVPPVAELQRKTDPRGFGLLAIVPVPDKGATAVIFVELAQCQTRHALQLASADWVPLILEGEPPTK